MLCVGSRPTQRGRSMIGARACDQGADGKSRHSMGILMWVFPLSPHRFMRERSFTLCPKYWVHAGESAMSGQFPGPIYVVKRPTVGSPRVYSNLHGNCETSILLTRTAARLSDKITTISCSADIAVVEYNRLQTNNELSAVPQALENFLCTLMKVSSC